MGALSSPRRLITDLTLPVLSLFSGKSVDAILKTALGEHGDIEDLWLAFFCCSTNLTRGELSTHVRGTTWKCVRASMTVLGLLPPVVSEDGDFLVDGGYLNSIPVDVMREKMGVETVIVVDVDDDDYLAFRNLTPHDGGLGGWRLLWERVNPFTAEWLSRSWLWRPWSATPDRGPLAPTATRARPPSYASLLNALMRATSNRALASASKDHEINLYLRPPGVASGWIAPMHAARVDALVRRAHRHASGAIADWQRAAREESTVRARSAAAEEAARREARARSGGRHRLGAGAAASATFAAGAAGAATPPPETAAAEMAAEMATTTAAVAKPVVAKRPSGVSAGHAKKPSVTLPSALTGAFGAPPPPATSEQTSWSLPSSPFAPPTTPPPPPPPTTTNAEKKATTAECAKRSASTESFVTASAGGGGSTSASSFASVGGAGGGR